MIKSDSLSIGADSDQTPVFTNHFLKLFKNDRLYFFSDGLVDQFGGIATKKFSSKRFRNLLLSIQHLNMEEQNTHVKKEILEWKGNNSQTDDICLVGIQI